jgi:hypothetical protein
MSDAAPSQILNADSAPVIERLMGEHWGGSFAPLTPFMKARGGTLGINRITVPPGRACVPFHSHNPDNGKVMVRGIGQIGRLEPAPYMDGEPDVPRILQDWQA